MLERLPKMKRVGRDTMILPCSCPSVSHLYLLNLDRGLSQGSLGDVVPRCTEQTKQRAGDGSERRPIICIVLGQEAFL